ncbi:MAG: DUF2934 domain-containing protein [Devosia sp.]
MMRKDTNLAEAIRRTAYFLWEQDGRPEGREVDYWLRAKEAHLRQIAYDAWLAEGAPAEAPAEEFWRKAEEAIAPNQPEEGDKAR